MALHLRHHKQNNAQSPAVVLERFRFRRNHTEENALRCTSSTGSVKVGIALVQNFEQLLVVRAVLGLGFGGEWAAGAVLMGETIRAQYRGRAVGSVQSGWAIGWGIAVIAQAVLFSYLPAEEAWRWMFAIGALP